MPYYEFVWTERALEKVAVNGVATEEVEAVICDPVKTGQSNSSGRPLAMGLAEDGRTLVCIYEIIDELRVLPITAFFSKPKP